MVPLWCSPVNSTLYLDGRLTMKLGGDVRGTLTGPLPAIEDEVVSMLISAILRNKGTTVATVRPGATVTELLAILDGHNIGAVVVSEDGMTITGIVSERDVVRHLHTRGRDVLDEPVSSIMTTAVRTCDTGSDVEDLRKVMTDHRIRHLPVLSEGRLAGIVSIGDVVKSAIEELEAEKAHLVDYLHG